MALSDTLGAERLASQYFLQRLGATRRAQHLAASEQFDLARSPLSDDELEDIVDQFRDTPQQRSGWGLSEGLEQVLSRDPKKIPISDLKALQNNLIAQGYAPPDAQATGIWDTSWYASFRRFDRDNFEAQRAGKHWYSAPISSGINALSNTLPSRVFQGIVGAAKGIVLQTPETAERLGALGGAAAGAAIGTAIVPGAGTLIGAGVGAVGGFLADLFMDDEDEPEDQSFLSNFVDALSPWTEYQQNPKDIFKDLGYTLTAASFATGIGTAARGAMTGIRTLQAARAAVPAVEAGAPVGGAAIANPLVEQVGLGSLAQQMPLAKAALLRPAGANQLGVFGTIARAASRRGFLPGSPAALEQTMLKYSGITFGQRLGPNIALKAFGGLSQAQMGARLFGGLGQGSRERTEEAKAALEAELGRSLTLEETRELEAKTAQTSIEKAITSAPELKTGIELPLLGDVVDLAAFVLYPERLLPFRGASVAKSSIRMMGDTSLAPFAHAIQHQNPGLGIRKAVSMVKGYLDPIDNAWLRADYGINREAHEIIARAYRGNVEKAFRSNALPNARADIIRTIRQEFDRNGKSELLEKVMRYSMDTVDGLDGPTDFTSWLVQLNGKHRGLDRLASWKEANVLARRVEREINQAAPHESLSRYRAGRSATEKPGTNIDTMVLKDRIKLLENRAKLYERRADRGALDPFTSIQLREQARLARAEAKGLQQNLDAIKGATKSFPAGKVVITPARLEFADRALLTAKRHEFLQLRQDVLNAVESGNKVAEPVARQKLANFVDELSADGLLPDELARKAKVAKPTERVAKYLEMQAKSAAKPIDLPEHYLSRFEELGYKPVATGDDVLFPDQLEQMIEIGGIGDYTRRAQVWETLGLSPKWRSDRALFRLRREHELAELGDVFKRTGVKMSPEQAMRRLYERLRQINHEGAALGPFVRSEGKTRLYKVDARDLSPDDVFRAFEDVPGVTDEVAHEIFGALRRGAAYGGEAHLKTPMQTMKAIGNAMRLNGLPGFSDVIRTAHSDVPYTIKRGAMRRGEFHYKPPSNPDSALDLAHSAERARIEAGLKEVAHKSNVTDGQRQFGMMMLDSVAQSQVRAGRFSSVDDFFRHVDTGYAERFDGGMPDALFKRISNPPTLKKLTALAREWEGTKTWYEDSARTLANEFGMLGKVRMRDGSEQDALDVITQLVAVTSPRKDPKQNFQIALDIFQAHVRGETPRGIVPSVKGMVNDVLDGKHIRTWEHPTRMPVSSQSRKKVWNFYHNLSGEYDKVTVDTWMARLFGFADNFTPQEYDEMAGLVKQVSDELGWFPAQTQAALWAAVKNQAANSLLSEIRSLEKSGLTAEANKLRRQVSQLRDASSYADAADIPKIRQSIDGMNGLSLLQRIEDDVLGATQFGPDFTATMRFFRNADFSTLVHENAHLLRRLMSDEDAMVLERAYGLGRQQGPEGASQEIRSIAEEYHRESGIPQDKSLLDQYPEVNEERAKRIADAFETGKHAPKDPATRRAYKAFATETMAQYAVLQRHGYKLIPWGKKGQPYKNAAEFIKDVRENKRLYYFKTLNDEPSFGAQGFNQGATDEMIADNPLLGDSGVTVLDSEGKPYKQTYNDIFRAVHDVFAHAKEGVQTGARGEESAWRAHAAMYSDEARRAMTTETRGQNSWVNFGPHLRDEAGNIPKKGEPGYVPLQDRPFSDQKVMLLPEEFSRLENVRWTREAEERFARDAENFILGKARAANPALETLKHAVGALWRQVRPAAQEGNYVPRSVRQLLDKTFEDVLKPLPKSRGEAAVRSIASKQAIGGAAAGGILGAVEGDDNGDILRGVALGAAGGLAARSALRRTYGYLPDYLTRLNTALRYTLSFTFDAGRFTEQNMIAMTKHGLPPMLSPTKYVKAREWRTPFGGAKVHGDDAWNHAVRFWDELNGTSWFVNIDDLDRRLFQAGMLGFSPRNWEIAQAFQLYQRGMGSEQIREAISQIGRYGLGRNAAEKSANFVVFPFSFSKKLLTTLGDFFLQAPARSLLLHEGMRRYHESEFDDKVNDFLERRLPLLKELSRINNLAFGISPGRFFLQGLTDQRSGVGKAMQVMASVFVPSGAATSLAQAAGGAGDLAVHAFSPIVLTGESITRGGGMDPVSEILRRYVPFVREMDQYFLADDSALREQMTAFKEGAAPYYQFQKYQDELKEAKSGYEALAPVLGYKNLDGLLQSEMGAGIGAELDNVRMALADKYPTGFAMSQQFENSDAIDQRALLDIAEKASSGRASAAEEHILELAELERSFDSLKQTLGLDASIVDAMAAKTIRDKALGWSEDRRFAELYDRFYLYTYGPIRRIA